MCEPPSRGRVPPRSLSAKDGGWRGTPEVHSSWWIHWSLIVFLPYFNTHVFSLDLSQGIASRWLEHFDALVCDQGFQREACGDELHPIFLHQAVLSARLVPRTEQGRIRILPMVYSYPYHLHRAIPQGRRVNALNDLVCVVYEELTLDPDRVEGLHLREPLRSWLAARVGERATER